jgi:hypothetical protein
LFYVQLRMKHFTIHFGTKIVKIGQTVQKIQL